MNTRPDKVEYEMLVRPHLASLYRTALRMVHHRTVAEDLVQETCLKAFASFSHGRQRDNFRAWLFRILVNVCIDYKRAARREAAVCVQAVPVGAKLATESPDPEQSAISRNLREQLSAAIEALAPELRLVVLLVLVEELSYAEAAESLEIPVGTVRSRLNRARAALQCQLSEPSPKRHRLMRVVTDGGVAYNDL